MDRIGISFAYDYLNGPDFPGLVEADVPPRGCVQQPHLNGVQEVSGRGGLEVGAGLLHDLDWNNGERDLM